MKSARLMMLGVALTMAGCGSSSGGSGGTPGGGGGAGFTAPSGSLGGTAFTATGAIGIAYTPAVCTIGGTVGFTMLQVLFTNVPNLCSAYLAVGQCSDKANLVAVNAGVQRYKPGGATTALTAGTYPLTLTTPAADANGNYTQTFIGYMKTNVTCVDAAAAVTTTAGSLTISTISATRVTGSLTATFSDGGSYSGPFDVPICADSTSICTMMNGCTGTPACVP